MTVERVVFVEDSSSDAADVATIDAMLDGDGLRRRACSVPDGRRGDQADQRTIVLGAPAPQRFIGHGIDRSTVVSFRPPGGLADVCPAGQRVTDATDPSSWVNPAGLSGGQRRPDRDLPSSGPSA